MIFASNQNVLYQGYIVAKILSFHYYTGTQTKFMTSTNNYLLINYSGMLALITDQLKFSHHWPSNFAL